MKGHLTSRGVDGSVHSRGDSLSCFSVLSVSLTLQSLYSRRGVRLDLTCCTSLVVSRHEESERNSESSHRFVYQHMSCRVVCFFREMRLFSRNLFFSVLGTSLLVCPTHVDKVFAQASCPRARLFCNVLSSCFFVSLCTLSLSREAQGQRPASP